MRPCVAVAAIVVSCAAASAGADMLVYSVTGTITNNLIMSGGFAGAPSGASVNLQITVDTSTTPVFSDGFRNHWDGVGGTILAVQATVNGYTSVITPNSAPAHARVVNDALLSGGPNYFDQFWMEVAATGAAPDFVTASFVMSRLLANPTVPSSLAGIDWPTDSSEIDASTFGPEKQIVLRLAGPQFLTATITSVSVVPAPGAAGISAIVALGCARRRRR